MKLFNVAECFSTSDDNLAAKLQNKIFRIFNRVGFFSASNPIKTIIISLTIVTILGGGLIKFRFEKNPLNLWVPTNNRFVYDSNWLLEKYKLVIREENILITAKNVLEPKNILKLSKLNEMIKNLNVTLDDENVLTYHDLCFQIPAVKELMETFRMSNGTTNNSNTFMNLNINMEQGAFCELIEGLPQQCYQRNILELWNYDDGILTNLTLEDVRDMLEGVESESGESITGLEIDALQLLGQKVRDSNDRVIGASTILSTWFLLVNLSHINYDEVGNVAGTEEWVSGSVLQWEQNFISAIMEFKEKFEDDDFKLYLKSGRSFADAAQSAIVPEINKIAVSVVLMFVYMQLILSKFNWIELRFLLGTFGLMLVLLSTIAASGLCSYFDMTFGPLHSSLPFLLMGLCVDDLFVIMACFRKVQQTNYDDKIAIQLGITLEQSAIAISVTTFTNFFAFFIGYTTEIPTIKSFCFVSMMGIVIMYLLVVITFMAIFALDEQRIASRRNAFFPFLKHTEQATKRWFDRNLMQHLFRMLYSKVILTKPAKILILMAVAIYTSFGFNSMLKLEKGSTPNYLIAKESYLYEYEEMLSQNYPNLGYDAGIYMEHINYAEVMPNLIQLSESLDRRKDLLYDLRSWIIPYSKFVWSNYKVDLTDEHLSQEDFLRYLSKFLYSVEGGKYQANIRFIDDLKCGEIPSNISMSQIEFVFKKPDRQAHYLKAVKTIEELLVAANITTQPTGYVTVWGKIFALWILDDLISRDFFQSIGLTLVCIMMCTVLLILNLQICFWIFICVILTLVNVCGYAQMIGIKIEAIFFIGLQLGIGLCVDYASHIGHTFIHIKGENRQEKALETIENIGAAVFYGSTSTLLAILPLAASPSPLIVLFTKIFFLVITFGVVHGILVMPIILSFIGPMPIKKNQKKHKIVESTSNINNTKL